MSIAPRPPIPSLIPESAPFTPEQRTWLNGLFAGMISLEESVTPLSNEQAAKLLPDLLDRGAPAEADDGAPWHDPAMPLGDRMKLADGKPLPRRMMAAMAQQDCSQCGYNCKDYADALFTKKEERLNLCVPGGKDTARMLKNLYAELGQAPPAAKADAAPAPAAAQSAPGRSRDNPVYATFLSRRRLNKPGSQKETWHIEFDLAECGLDYVVGDSFGIYPANDAALVEAVLSALDAPPDFPIGGRTLREALTDGVSLSPAPDMLFQLIKRTRLGVASTFLAGRVSPGDKIRVYVQKAQHFALPADPKVPIIMIGPGTGLAPFRAFLQERMATKAPGRNWLFFGHQRSNYDFFYEDELVAMRSAGLLTRLTLAWSRDAEEKTYVQHRMREVGRDLWSWLADGAHVYICGDATRMAKDVERTLVDVIAEHGARTPAEAASFLAEMKKQDRYQTDVY